MKQDTTIEVAQYWAKIGTAILFAEGDIFNGTVDRGRLENTLYNQILENLVDYNTSDISEQQLQDCIKLSKINNEEKTAYSREASLCLV